jgi:putative ABC transport system permease protein
MRVGPLVVRAALRAFPAPFREKYAREMLEDFEHHWRNTQRSRDRTWLLVRTVPNLLTSAIAEHRRSSFAGSAPMYPVRREGRAMLHLTRDLRHAARALRGQPLLTSFLVMTLAVGIGATTAVFTVVNSVLLEPLHLPQSGNLVAIWGRFDPESGFNYPRFVLSAPEVVDYRRETQTLGGVAAWQPITVTVRGGGAEPDRVPAAAVTGNFFSLLRVSPERGRTFTPDEDRPQHARVAMLSAGYWRSRFGADPDIVGRTVPLNGEETTIVGVMPPGFTYPSTSTSIWIPLGIDPASPGSRKSHSLRAIGRLREGVSLQQARAELATIMAGWKARYPDVHTGHYLFIRPLLDDTVGSVRPALLALLVATAFVVLIGCANLAGVLMSRGEGRTREMSIRAALGARRGELIRLTLAEAGILSLFGGTLGLLLAWIGVRGLLAVDPSSIPRSSEIAIDGRVPAFALAISMATAGISGVLPALRGAAAAARGTLRESSHATTAAGGRQRVRRALVAAEVALSVVLVLGAGVMLRGFNRLLATDPGFRPAGLVTASIALPSRDYPAAEQVEALYSSVLDRLRRAPGVAAASAASNVPLLNEAGVWDFEIEGRPAPPAGEMAWNAAAVIARRDYARTVGIPVERGRFFRSQDDARSMMVTVISDTMAKRFFPGRNPIGHRIRVKGVTAPAGWMTIVGVIGDVHDVGLEAAPRPTYYIAQPQVPSMGEGPYRQMAIVIRVSGSPDAAIAALRSVVHDLDPRLPLFDIESMDAVLDQSVARPRFTTTLLVVFAIVGILLGAGGIYGVLAYTVATRTPEIGIRRALGAPATRILSDVMRGGLWPVCLGLAIGLLLSYWTSRALATEVLGVSGTDLTTYAVAVLAVFTVALVSCAVPAARALRVSPLAALRSE